MFPLEVCSEINHEETRVTALSSSEDIDRVIVAWNILHNTSVWPTDGQSCGFTIASTALYTASKLCWRAVKSHAIADMTARCTQYRPMSALKIYVSAKSADDCAWISTLQNITIRRWNYFRSVSTIVITIPKRYRWTDRRTIYCIITARWKKDTKHRRYYRYRQYFKLKIRVYCRFKNRHGPSLHTPTPRMCAIN